MDICYFCVLSNYLSSSASYTIPFSGNFPFLWKNSSPDQLAQGWNVIQSGQNQSSSPRFYITCYHALVDDISWNLQWSSTIFISLSPTPKRSPKRESAWMRKSIQDKKNRMQYGRWKDGFFGCLDSVMCRRPCIPANKLPFGLKLIWIEFLSLGTEGQLVNNQKCTISTWT